MSTTTCEPGAISDRRRRRGILPTAVLLLLHEHCSHGYDLAARLPELGVEDTDTGGLYRALRTLEADGLVESHWDGPSRGPARRVYGLTAAGHRCLIGTLDALVQDAKVVGTMARRLGSPASPH